MTAAHHWTENVANVTAPTTPSVDAEVLAKAAALDVDPQFMQALSDYSSGRSTRTATMDALGIDYYGDLLCLLNEVGLQHPVAPSAQREAMTAEMVAAIRSLDASGVDGNQHRGKGVSKPAAFD